MRLYSLISLPILLQKRSTPFCERFTTPFSRLQYQFFKNDCNLTQSQPIEEVLGTSQSLKQGPNSIDRRRGGTNFKKPQAKKIPNKISNVHFWRSTIMCLLPIFEVQTNKKTRNFLAAPANFLVQSAWLSEQLRLDGAQISSAELQNLLLLECLIL